MASVFGGRKAGVTFEKKGICCSPVFDKIILELEACDSGIETRRQVRDYLK